MLLRTCDHCEAPAFIRNYSGPEAVLGHRKAQELGCVRVGYKRIRKHIGSIKSLRNVVGCQVVSRDAGSIPEHNSIRFIRVLRADRVTRRMASLA
jgi:hypothetical protein